MTLLIFFCFMEAGALALLAFTGWHYQKTMRQTALQTQNRLGRLGGVLRATKAGVWIYTINDDTFTWLDQAGQPVRRLTAAQLRSSQVAADYTQLQTAIDQLMTGRQKKITRDVQLLNPQDKQQHDMLVNISVLDYDNDGRPLTIIGVSRDVTIERSEQARAKEMLMRYHSVFSTSMTDMMYFDAEGKLEEVNARSCETFQCEPQELLSEGLTAADIMGAEDAKIEDIQNFHATQFLNQPGQKVNVRARHRTDKMYYELQMVPVFDEHHHLLGIYGSGRDVTETVVTWRRLQQGLATLQKANQRLEDYIKNINLILTRGNISMVNYFPDTHTLKLYSEMDRVRYEMTQVHMMRLALLTSRPVGMRQLDTMDARQPKDLHAEIVTNMMTAEGQHRTVRFDFIPIYNKEKRVDHYYGMCRDLTAIKLTEQRLMEETKLAQETEDLKNSFLRNMSFEIRTPLNSIVGFAELFSTEHTAEDEQLFVDEIRKSSNFLLHLINDILFLSRLDAQMIELKPQPTDFPLLFEHQCQNGIGAKRKPDVDYVVENNYEQLVIDVDPQNLGIAIVQLVENAVKFTDSGTVRCRYDYLNGKLVICISDTGMGIPKNQLPHIFERFHAGIDQDTGLGMSIVHELVRQMGGTVDITSTEGKGTTVWLTIPCKMTEMARK